MAGLFDFDSLRGKISAAYLALVTATAVLAVIAVSDLFFLERQVREGGVVSDLKDAVLEMRREEKNLFLYADNEARQRADEYARRSLLIIQKEQPALRELLAEMPPEQIIHALDRYRQMLATWPGGESADKLQRELRTLGHRIYLYAEQLATDERRMLETAVRESQWLLLFSLFVIGLSIFLVGRQLKQLVVKPVAQLESRLQAIAHGRFNHLEAPSDDREFITFTRAFNRMLVELESHQKRMMQSEKLASLGILAAGVAHELNNPLSNISTATQLLSEELEEAEVKQLRHWLAQIDSETGRGRKIVRSLLDFGSQRSFCRQPCQLRELINDTLLIMGKTLKQHLVQLNVNVADELVIEVDRQRMQQLFINLIQNAINAKNRGLTLHLSAVLCDQGLPMIHSQASVAGNLKKMAGHDGRFIEILVMDDGPGMPADVLACIFDPFFTTGASAHGVAGDAGNTPGDEVNGSGLGMYIVQEIVNEHDGVVAVTSTPGRGTQVTVLLPAVVIPQEGPHND